MRFQLTVKGDDQILTDLREGERLLPTRVNSIVWASVRELRADLKRKPYPPKLPNQRYVRTGKLANSYSARRERRNLYSVRNSAPYASYVVNEGTQADIHREDGRWWTVQSVATETERTNEVLKDIEKAITEVLNG